MAVVGGVDDTRPHYRMLASPRAPALEQLCAAGEEDALPQRHALALAQLYDEHWHTRHSGALRVVDWKREVELDAPNAAAAMAWAVRAGMSDCALTIGATWLHAMNRSMHADRMRLADLSPDALKGALDELDRIEDPAWPPQRLDMGLEAHSFFLSRSDAGPEAATARPVLIRRTAAIAAQLGDDVETSLDNLMDAELASGAVDAAARTGHALIEQLSGTRNERILAHARLNLGACHLPLDELGAARAMLQAAWAKAVAFEMQPYCADDLALPAALEHRPRAAAWLAGYSGAGCRAKPEGRERNEAAASERMAAPAIAGIGVDAFENGRAGGCALKSAISRPGTYDAPPCWLYAQLGSAGTAMPASRRRCQTFSL